LLAGAFLFGGIVLRRKIYVTGAIDEESYLKFSKRLTILEEQEDTPVEIELFSFGGETYAALAYFSRMRRSNCHLVVYVHGLVASAAVLILAGGDERYMAKDAWVMVHEDSGQNEGSVSMQENAIVQMRRLELQWNELLASRTKLTAADWQYLHEQTTYMNAKKCLKAGLIEGTF